MRLGIIALGLVSVYATHPGVGRTVVIARCEPVRVEPIAAPEPIRPALRQSATVQLQRRQLPLVRTSLPLAPQTLRPASTRSTETRQRELIDLPDIDRTAPATCQTRSAGPPRARARMRSGQPQ